ncbi:MAG: helix-turn-helix domain-containing protein [Prevotella sp.]|nr:helix-turn-helix transcriptional regulator [Bacteroidales bacterium]MDY4228306.1 helix-turn-helix domain-containing protein [Prevotella sp.]
MKKEANPEYLTCPIRQVISRFGDKWSLLVLYTLDRSQTGVMRFNELHAHMSDCSQKMLSKTLKDLQASHLVGRKVYAEVPPRVEYRLTDVGQSLIPTLDQLIGWAKTHFDEVVRP